MTPTQFLNRMRVSPPLLAAPQILYDHRSQLAQFGPLVVVLDVLLDCVALVESPDGVILYRIETPGQAPFIARAARPVDR